MASLKSLLARFQMWAFYENIRFSSGMSSHRTLACTWILFASWTLKGSASGGVWGVSPIKSFNETRLQINDGNFYVKFFRPHSLLSGSGRGRGN